MSNKPKLTNGDFLAPKLNKLGQFVYKQLSMTGDICCCCLYSLHGCVHSVYVYLGIHGSLILQGRVFAVASDVKFRTNFCPEIFHEIFLKYFKNFTMYYI